MSLLDKIATNIIILYLRNTSKEQLREVILGKRTFSLDKLPDSEWKKYRVQCKMFPGLQITYPLVVEAFRKNRPDLLSVVSSTPGGYEWAQKFVTHLRLKLGMEKYTITKL